MNDHHNDLLKEVTSLVHDIAAADEERTRRTNRQLLIQLGVSCFFLIYGLAMLVKTLSESNP